jgi:DNA-binding LacI/PurR family transcriptional regulator
MEEGRWRGTVPGRDQLADELGCSHWTVETAMRRLAKEGLLVSQGPGRRRRIVLSKGLTRARTLRVMILLYENSDKKRDYLVELFHRLQEAGSSVAFAAKTMRDLGMDVKRIARFASAQEADAWVVVAGPRDVLEWFSQQAKPAFALFGRSKEVPLAATAPKKGDAYADLVKRLVGMGHRSIVSVVREDRRKPTPAFVDRLFLEQLGSHGIQTGPYNLPDWEDSPEGLVNLLDSLFQHTPPTALLLDEPALFFAARDHLARKGIIAPEHVSLVCCDHDAIFEWCRPSIAHIAWDVFPLIRRVVKWAENISRGKDDRRKSTSEAWLVVGGTIGPMPASRRP